MHTPGRMPQHADQQSDNAHTAVAKPVLQGRSVVDHRAAAAAQRKLAELGKHSPLVQRQQALSDAAGLAHREKLKT